MRTTPNTAAAKRLVRAYVERMEQASIDEVVTHDELVALMPSQLVPYGHYIFVARARDILNKEQGLVFATVVKEGYRRLPNTVGALHVGQRALLGIRRTARRAQRFALNAIRQANDAAPAERRQVYQQVSTLGIVEHLTLAKSVSVMPEDPPTREDGLDGLRRMLGR